MSVGKLQQVEQERGKPIKAVLIELHEKHGSLKKVADELGVTRSTLWAWLLRTGLEEKSILVEREAYGNK